MNKKQEYGQFFTTNHDYILQNMDVPTNTKTVIEPFTGNGDLLNIIPPALKDNLIIECYDIDPQNDNTIKRDTLFNPPSYKNKFVLTNPPYLARNKNNSKTIYDKYDTNDLYKCFIKTLISDPCSGGIIIIPLNFISSIRKGDIHLRKEFLQVYDIELINVFEEKVFDDTSYTVCSILFCKTQNKDLKESLSLEPIVGKSIISRLFLQGKTVYFLHSFLFLNIYTKQSIYSFHFIFLIYMAELFIHFKH